MSKFKVALISCCDIMSLCKKQCFMKSLRNIKLDVIFARITALLQITEEVYAVSGKIKMELFTALFMGGLYL